MFWKVGKVASVVESVDPEVTFCFAAREPDFARLNGRQALALTYDAAGAGDVADAVVDVAVPVAATVDVAAVYVDVVLLRSERGFYGGVLSYETIRRSRDVFEQARF